jgi:AcrR family transcriptional regulator
LSNQTERRARQAASQPIAPPVTARGARTRAALKRSGRNLFEKHGFQDTSVNQISTRARVAHGTFYTYFDSKEQIFGEIIHDLFMEFNRVMTEQPPAEGASLSHRIERANRGYLTAYCDNARLMAALEQAATLSTGLAEIRRATRVGWIVRNTAAIARWQERGDVDEHIDPRYAAEILGCMVDRTAYVSIVLEASSFDLEETSRQLTRLYCNAIGITYFRDVTSMRDGLAYATKPPQRGASRRAT